MLMRLIWLTAVIVLAGTRAHAGEIQVAFWNVENLFDIVDDPKVELDEEFTPSAAKKWTDERLQQKLTNLARVISAMNAKRGPDILALAEIENRNVLVLLIEKLKPLGRDYKIVHQDSPSGRGIDCAILFDDKVLDLSGSRFHQIKDAAKPTRDIVEAELKLADQTLFVFSNHWPSRGNPESDRIVAAEVLRRRVDELLKANPAADIVIVGDLNDFPGDKSISEVLRAKEKIELDSQPGTLLDAMWPTLRAGDQGSYVYQNKWEVIDHVIVSSGVLDDHGFQLKTDSVGPALVVPNQLFDPKGAAIPRPNRTYSGDFYHRGGYSDHLPIQASFNVP